MEEACVYVGIYVGISGRTRDEPIRSIWTISHAHMADVDAICCIRNTDSERKCETAKGFYVGAGSGSVCKSRMELV